MTAWKRHWKIPATLLALMIGLLCVSGSHRIVAYVGAGGDTSSYGAAIDYENEIDLFDGSVIHDVHLEIEQADLEAMVRLYREDDGAKDWFSADITIDGTLITGVGVRLKGFSTLRTALGEVSGPGLAEVSGEVDYDELPFLVRLDEFNPGVSYQGITEIALRTEGPTEDDTLLEEIVTVRVIEQIGLSAPSVAYMSMSLNGAPPTLRIVAENPTDEYAERILGDSSGVLYKAQSSGTFQYLGHDPIAYEGVFEQESAINEQDLAPLMDFVEFVETSSDAEFAADLDAWLDVEAFIDYLAIHNLLVNVDSLAGTNHNFYLLYDLDEDRMTVLSWDMNESLGGFWRSDGGSWTLAPDWSNATSTFGRPPLQIEGRVPAGMPGGPPGGQDTGQFGPPPAGEKPQIPDQGGAPGGMPAEGPAGAGPGGRNVLLDRFLAVEAYSAAYEIRYAELSRLVFGGGLLADAIGDAAGLLVEASDLGLLTDREVSNGIRERMEWVRERAAFLERLDLG